MAWIEALVGKVVVIKFGGNAMVEQKLIEEFAEDVAKIHKAGVKVVVVHGGGPQISAALEEAGVESSFVSGLRVTSPEALPIIRDVLMGQISQPLVELIRSNGVESIPLNGITEDLLLAQVTRADLGRVGEVFAVRDSYLRELLAASIVPVISSIAPDDNGELVNVNADLAASSAASALGAEELVMLTDVDGLYENYPDVNSLIKSISSAQLEKLAPNLTEGMIPKVEACLAARYSGVAKARIINGSVPHSLWKLNENPEHFGTRVEG